MSDTRNVCLQDTNQSDGTHQLGDLCDGVDIGITESQLDFSIIDALFPVLGHGPFAFPIERTPSISRLQPCSRTTTPLLTMSLGNQSEPELVEPWARSKHL